MWALFSEANQYYQPKNNLIVLYEFKPSFEELKEVLYGQIKIEALEEHELINVVNLLQGKEVFVGMFDSDCRLEEIEFGQVLDPGDY